MSAFNPSSDDRPARYETDDNGKTIIVYRSSSIGGCPKMLAALGLDYDPADPPDSMQQKFDEGHDWEDRVLAKLAKNGVKEKTTGSMFHVKLAENSSQKKVRYPVLGPVKGRAAVEVRAALDAMGEIVAINDNGEDYDGSGMGYPTHCMVEVKFLGDDLFNDFVKKGIDFKENYRWQVSTHIHGMGMPVLFVCAKKVRSKSGKVIAIGEMLAQWIVTPPVSAGEFVNKITAVEKIISSGNLDTAPCTNQYPCPVYYLHDIKPERESFEDELLMSLVEQKANAERQIKVWEAKKKAAQEGIFGFFEEKKIKGGSYEVGKYVVSDVWAEQPETVVTRAAYTQHYVKVALKDKPKKEKK